MSDLIPLITPTVTGEDGLPVDRLLFTNEGATRFRWDPRTVQVKVDLSDWPQSTQAIDTLYLELPPGWMADRDVWQSASQKQPIGWNLTPEGMPAGFQSEMAVVALTGVETVARWAIHLPIEWRGQSQFDPPKHAFPLPNRSS